MLKEKIDFGFKYRDIFEGNFSIIPLIRSPEASQKKLGSLLIEDLLDNITLWLKLTNDVITNQMLVKRICVFVGLSCLDEIYCATCILTHLIYAWK